MRDWLAQNDLAEDTVVILMGDNGFLFGEHGLIDKRNAYEESMRVPLLMAAPSRIAPGQVVDEMVANIDIAPTLLHWAGLEPPAHYDGMSFADLARPPGGVRASVPWREELTYEYYWEFNYPQTPTVFALRTERFKYIQYHGVWDTEELFDLDADPAESNNLIEHPDYQGVKVELRERLFASLENRAGDHAIPYTRKFNQGAVFRHEDRSEAAEYPEKWLRGADADDRWEHVIPDGPEKPAILETVREALRDY